MGAVTYTSNIVTGGKFAYGGAAGTGNDGGLHANGDSGYAANGVTGLIGLPGNKAVSKSANLFAQGTLTHNVVVRTRSLPRAHKGALYSTALAALDGIKPYHWSIASGRLPNGLSLKANGVIAGRPTVVTTAHLTVRVVDSAKAATHDTQALTLVVT
jgi:hypothetical protein